VCSSGSGIKGGTGSSGPMATNPTGDVRARGRGDGTTGGVAPVGDQGGSSPGDELVRPSVGVVRAWSSGRPRAVDTTCGGWKATACRPWWTPTGSVGHNGLSARFRREAAFSLVIDALVWRAVQ